MKNEPSVRFSRAATAQLVAALKATATPEADRAAMRSILIGRGVDPDTGRDVFAEIGVRP